MGKIVSHLSPEYKALKIPHTNGAYFYSVDLVNNIIPKIKTDRNWILINAEHQCFDHSIVFIHNNAHPERYTWLLGHKDLILVCSTYYSLKIMQIMFPKFHCIYIPLSIDTKYVKQFKPKRKSKETAFFGRLCKCPREILENDKITKIAGDDRESLLKEVGKFKKVYAIGRCALEAKCLGCKVINHKGEYDGEKFRLLDNKDIIPELQRLINEIDGKV